MVQDDQIDNRAPWLLQTSGEGSEVTQSILIRFVMHWLLKSIDATPKRNGTPSGS